MFIADARMALGSALLKRLFVSESLGIPWHDVKFTKRGDPVHGKPCVLLPDGVSSPLDFNISHQAGLVALIGWNGTSKPISSESVGENDPIHVGADIVCVNERDDWRNIDLEGFDGWIDIYEEIFSEEERWDMKFNVDSVTLLDGQILTAEEIGRHDRCLRKDVPLTVTRMNGQQVTFNSDLLLEAKLRRFYTFFCYKEAYIKLAGEALLAPWLKQLEFHNVKSPKAGTVARCSTHGTWGERIDDVEILMRGNKVENVKMVIQAFEENFMFATAVQGNSKTEIPPFEKLDLEHDILAVANMA